MNTFLQFVASPAANILPLIIGLIALLLLALIFRSAH